MRIPTLLLSPLLALGLTFLGCDRAADDDDTGDDDATADDDDSAGDDDDDTTAGDDDSVGDDDTVGGDDDDTTAGDDDTGDDDDDDDTAPGDDDDTTSDDDDDDDDDTTSDDDDDTTTNGGPDIEVLPTALNYGDVYWGYPETLTLQIANVGDADLTVTSMGSGVPPLTLIPFTGIIAPGDTETVDVAANCAGTELSYNGFVVIGSDDADENPLQVPVFIACDEA
jgi:hypothetical protein